MLKSKPKPATKMSAENPVPRRTAKPKLTYAFMVDAAIKGLNDRNGSSIQAIMQYIRAHSEVDATKGRIKKAVKLGIAAGNIKRAAESGKGSQCYMIGEKPLAKKPAAKKPAAATEPEA